MEAEGRKPHWRFRLANSEDGLTPLPTIVSWNDLIRGDQMVDVGSLSDPVLIRADGSFLYTFTSVVDDIDFAITHVVRGEDHVTNTGVQIQLFEALERDPPAFGHHSLLIGADGQALSKRLGALSIASLRESGLEPWPSPAYTALIGTSDAIAPHASLDELASIFDLRQDLYRARRASIPTSSRRSTPSCCINCRSTHVAGRLEARGIDGGAGFWAAVRGNLSVLRDAGDWWRIATGARSR